MNLEKMPLGKRSYGSSYSARAKRARMTGSMTRGVRAVTSRKLRGRTYTGFAPLKNVVSRVNRLYNMIETKELSYRTASNVALPHNNPLQLTDTAGLAFNVLRCFPGNDDPMAQNTGSRLGDQYACKGVMIKGMFENALNRSKVFYRVMLLKGAKGETFNRANIFKNDTDNKMLDQINTERFTIIAQKTFNIECSNQAPITVDASGQIATGGAAGIGSKIFKMWIPGAKFGRNGIVQFENASTTQVKFFDYRILVLAYDWYGTPQDINNVGRINELYSKTYFKDA